MRTAPAAFHVMAKPTGAACNLSCDYCFFLAKERLHPDRHPRMSERVMEAYIRQTLESQKVPLATIAWQGGEPTLMGLDFFRRTIEVEKKYAREGQRVERTLMTNGVLLDDQWCRFLRENDFLVGLSIDGPRELHDAYRHDKGGRSVFDRVIRALRLLQKHEVRVNVLCTVNARNAARPLDLYRFFRDELDVHYLQLIPIVERDNLSGNQRGEKLTDRTVSAEAYGRFLIGVFDEWVRNDVGSTFVQTFDGTLAAFIRGQSTLCVFRPTCGDGVALGHNGDLYSCDHFVEPRYRLGNITKTPLAQLVGSQKQRRFGQAKSKELPRTCKQCKYLFACYGECPKNRVLRTSEGERGLNWLCSGLKAYFAHVEMPMRMMAGLLASGRSADEIMPLLAQQRALEPFAGALDNTSSVAASQSTARVAR